MSDTPLPLPPSFAGGEVAPEIRALHQNALRTIMRDKDIHRVHGLHMKEDGSFLYMAATTYATFPKYIIGHANAELTEARILVQCGEEWNAQSKWTQALTLPKP